MFPDLPVVEGQVPEAQWDRWELVLEVPLPVPAVQEDKVWHLLVPRRWGSRSCYIPLGALPVGFCWRWSCGEVLRWALVLWDTCNCSARAAGLAVSGTQFLDPLRTLQEWWQQVTNIRRCSWGWLSPSPLLVTQSVRPGQPCSTRW